MNNPLTKDFKSKFGLPPFEEIKPKHYLPAIKKAIADHKTEIELILKNKEKPTFRNTINALENAGSLLSKVSRVFFNVLSADSSDELQKIAAKVTPLLSKHRDSISLNVSLFKKVKKVYESNEDLSDEQRRLVKITYDNFMLNGSGLDSKKRALLKKINQKLSSLSLNFGQNTLKETNAFELVINDKTDLDGLPKDLVNQAKLQAEKENYKGAWLFKATRENLYPFLTFSKNRNLREEI